ncbi:serine/threonine protein kinase [Nonomuraea coxensis]|uniref:serine/threonine protein kinase n=1 Tax=Nonomuraea coxensis TaxID=404386 RepID=UPI000688F8B0|nr:protein kinase [Nonomuraea coxensis]
MTESDPSHLGEHALAGVLRRTRWSVVYLGRSAAGPVAIELLPPGHVESRRALAAAAERVTEPSVARVLGSGLYGDRLYVVAEHVEGVPLAELIRREGPRDAAWLHRLAAATAGALAAMHEAGVTHLGLGPDAVVLGPEGPKVTGFGVHRHPDPEAVPAFLAPEQVAGHPAGPPADLFSWAATMAYAATGVPPFGADAAQAVAHRVLNVPADLSPLPEPLRAVVDRCLAKQPDHRLTARQALASLHGDRPQPTAAPQPFYGPTPVHGPSPAPAARGFGLVAGLVTGVVAVLVVAAVAAYLLLGRAAPEPAVVATAAPSAEAETATRASVAGRWAGTYVCNQGKTTLRLIITEKSPGELTAVFAFTAHAGNPGVPPGSFAMTGRLDGRTLRLDGERWIDRPGEYLMVGLRADLTDDRPATISGTVIGGGCTTFEISRQNQ